MNDQRHIEALEILAGMRPGNKNRRAVRIEHVSGILRLPPQPQSATVTTTPTVAQFNALVQDVHDIHAALTTLRNAIQKQVL